MSLGRFLQQSGENFLLAPQSTNSQTVSQTTALAIREITDNPEDAENIVARLTACIRSNEFASTLDQIVGEPLPTETEDEFVKRASAFISRLLKVFLDKDRNA